MVNTTAAIMAIPSPLDSIRLVGDEEKHATILYFGETSTLPDNAREILVDAVDLAAGMLFPFSESVREVTRLGSELPPALVAMLSNGSDLEKIRDLFSMNPFVSSYQDNTVQFPRYTPHVTLGHPDFAEEGALKSLCSQLRRVHFDRLAVWWNDERIEFQLSREPDDETVPMEHAISEFVELFSDGDEDAALAHFGVKGQKWGVRRNANARETAATLRRVADGTASKGDKFKVGLGSPIRPGGVYAFRNAGKMADRLDRAVDRREARSAVKAVKQASKQVAKDDKKYDASLRGVHGFIKVNNAIAAKVNPKLEVLNNKPKYKGVMMLEPKNAAIHKAYIGEYRKLLQTSLDETMSEIGTNASETKRLQLHVVGEGLNTTWEASLDEIKHADAQVAEVLNGFRIVPTFNKLGQIVSQKVEQLEMAHTDDISDVLAHYGIKGQKWGVRRATDSSGLVARKSSADQIQTDRIVKKLQTGGTSALSNQDLQDFTRRLQLEREFNRAAAEHQAKAQSAITKFIKKQGVRQANRLADKTVDIAVEQALAFAGVKAEKSLRFGLSDNINEVNKRIKPKKKG